VDKIVLNRFANLREKLIKYPGNVMPKPIKSLDRKIERRGNGWW